MQTTNYYRIADFGVKLITEDVATVDLLPSFQPFHSALALDDLLFTMQVGEHLVDENVEAYEEIGQFDCGGANHGVYHNAEGYKFFIYSVEGELCSIFQTRAGFSDCRISLFKDDYADRSFGLNNAMMIAFAFSSAHKGTLMMHSSVIVSGGRAYFFQGKSGTGKSTHSRLWFDHIPGCELLNDDNPVVRIFDDGSVMAYGTPWSGKTPCYRNKKAPLGAFLRLEQYPENIISKQNKLQSFASILSSCSTMIWDKPLYRAICDTVGKIAERVPSYYLKCLPNAEAARLSHDTMTGNL